eukprot:3409569-Lingulodinium_polyedra.AAC.1
MLSNGPKHGNEEGRAPTFHETEKTSWPPAFVLIWRRRFSRPRICAPRMVLKLCLSLSTGRVMSNNLPENMMA